MLMPRPRLSVFHDASFARASRSTGPPINWSSLGKIHCPSAGPWRGRSIGSTELVDKKESEEPLHQPVLQDDAYQEASRLQTVYARISKAMDEQEDGKTSDVAFAKSTSDRRLSTRFAF